LKIRITLLDKLFSHYIRWIRDKGICQRCLKAHRPPSSGLHCSHFHGRAKKSTRFDEDNTQALCYGCHAYLGANPIEHMEHMRRRLGDKRFDLLTLRAHTPGRPDYKALEIWLKGEFKRAQGDIIGGKA
jgi:hypothetical protein